MKESKKAILKSLLKDGKKSTKFDLQVLSLALQKIEDDSFDFDGEAVYTDDRKRLVYCLSSKSSFTVPDSVETIGEMGFRRKKALKNVIIPSTVKVIEQDAFYDCDNLDNIFIPASVETVKGYAFADCDALKTVTFGGVPQHLSNHVFEECDDLHTIFIPEGTEKKFHKALHYNSSEDEYMLVEKKSNK